MNDKHDLELILRSHVPIITIETHEERRATELLARAASKLGKNFYLWTITDGLRPHKYSSETLELVDADSNNFNSEPETDPIKALRKIKSSNCPGIYALLDFHNHFDDPVIVRLIKEIAQDHSIEDKTLVLISHENLLPPEIAHFSARFNLSLPDKEKIKQLLHDEAKVWALKNGNNVKADAEAMELLISNLVGLTVTDTKRFLRSAIHDDGAITHADLPDIQKAKYDLLGQDGLVSFEYDTAKFSDVGGMKQLKQWLEKRKALFINPEKNNTLGAPKGILLVGVQGGGKSLTAKAVAGVWGVPLLRLDFGVLYNKFFGETEKNIRKALKLAEVMSPCVLWIDEIEKGIASGDHDSGTSRRVLGTLLTWMAENDKHVFIVATANDIQSLPPELIRKGRLDEIFFVDLPNQETRQEIFKIHLNKREHDASQFDLSKLADQSEQFSGAEIEQAIVSACYSALSEETTVAMQHLTDELKRTKPLSIVMAEKINGLRDWAKERTVAAN